MVVNNTLLTSPLSPRALVTGFGLVSISHLSFPGQALRVDFKRSSGGYHTTTDAAVAESELTESYQDPPAAPPAPPAAPPAPPADFVIWSKDQILENFRKFWREEGFCRLFSKIRERIVARNSLHLTCFTGCAKEIPIELEKAFKDALDAEESGEDSLWDFPDNLPDTPFQIPLIDPKTQLKYSDIESAADWLLDKFEEHISSAMSMDPVSLHPSEVGNFPVNPQLLPPASSSFALKYSRANFSQNM